MKPLALLLLLTLPAQAQWVPCDASVVCEPMQCWGGYCQPQYTQPQYAQPQPIQPNNPGTQDRPQFIPRPEPLAPVQPVPAEDTEENKKLLALMSQNTQILVSINATLKDQKPCECDNSALLAKLDQLAAALAQQSGAVPPPGPSPTAGQHVVIVADRNADYWQPLAETIARTKQSYHGIQVEALPTFPIGEHPQAVIYEASVPVRVVKGRKEVELLLYRLSRAEPI